MDLQTVSFSKLDSEVARPDDEEVVCYYTHEQYMYMYDAKNVTWKGIQDGSLVVFVLSNVTGLEKSYLQAQLL